MTGTNPDGNILPDDAPIVGSLRGVPIPRGPQRHDHLFTVPVEWETTAGSLSSQGEQSPAVTVVTKLKCGYCPKVMSKNDSED
jgi:hypothetical protein